MVIKVLAANAIAVSIRVVSPAEDPRIKDIVRKEITGPVFAVRSRPSLISVSV